MSDGKRNGILIFLEKSTKCIIYATATKLSVEFMHTDESKKIEKYFVKTLDNVSPKWYNVVKDRGKPSEK